MATWECRMCGYTYDEEVKGVPFDELPDDWVCPWCKAPKKYFDKVEY
ncbi:MAG: rubredoxin [Candidatus Thorarchaeota archaeon]